MKNTLIVKLFAACALLMFGAATAQAQVITTIAGNGIPGAFANGSAAINAQITSPFGVVVNAVGDIYFSELETSKICKISASGIITTAVGANGPGYTGDGRSATSARLLYPASMGIDAAGNIYIADWGNNVIRKINTIDTITTVAGNGIKGYSGDGGPAVNASLDGPTIYVTPGGVIYISELNNHRIRRVSGGNITTVAGRGVAGSSPDGTPAMSAAMNPYTLTVDATGNIYYVDEVNPVYRVIRKIDAVTNTISTFSPYWAQAMAFGPDSFLYFADEACYVRKVVNGTAHTYAGNGVCIAVGDSGLAKASGLNTPMGLAFDPARNLFVTEREGARIRKITYYDPTVGVDDVACTSGIRVFPNPAAGAFTIELPSVTQEASIVISDLTGRIFRKRTVAPGKGVSEEFKTNNLPPGAYLIEVSSAGKVYRGKIVVM